MMSVLSSNNKLNGPSPISLFNLVTKCGLSTFFMIALHFVLCNFKFSASLKYFLHSTPRWSTGNIEVWALIKRALRFGENVIFHCPAENGCAAFRCFFIWFNKSACLELTSHLQYVGTKRFRGVCFYCLKPTLKFWFRQPFLSELLCVGLLTLSHLTMIKQFTRGRKNNKSSEMKRPLNTANFPLTDDWLNNV